MKREIRQSQVLTAVLVVAFATLCLLNPRTFISVRNFQSIAVQMSDFGLMAVAISLAMLTGGIDLSVIAVANLSSILSALILHGAVAGSVTLSGGMTGLVMAVAILVALAAGTLCGLVNGLLVTKVGITPILATLGTMTLFKGFSMVITRGTGIVGFPQAFLTIGTGTLAWVPVPLIILAVISVVLVFVLGRTKFGVSIYLLGTNETAARYSGIRVDRVLMRVYMLCGLLAGIAGIIMISKVDSARPNYAESYLMPAILVVVLGGYDPAGGSGKIGGLVVALIMLQILQSGFNLMGASAYSKNLIWGAMLIFVMILNYFRRKRAVNHLD